MTASVWYDKTLGEVILLQRGFDLTEKSSVPGRYPVISSGGISYTTASPKVDGPGVVTGRKGVLGKVHFCHGPYWPHDTTLWVKDFKGNDPRYVYYLLQTLSLALLDAGASNPTLNRNHAHLLRVRVPDFGTQRKIAIALSSFDDLIENNRRRIEVLEEAVRLIYREWFVHFRFPGHEGVEVVDSDLGPIPKHWEAGAFSDLVEVRRDAADPEEMEPGSPLVGLEHLPRRSTTLRDWDLTCDVGSRKSLFVEGDILFGKIRPYFHKVVLAPINGYCSTDAIVFRPRPEARGQALAVASSDDFVAHAVQTSNGTKMPRANTEVLLHYPVPIPPDGVRLEFESTVRPINAICQNLSAGMRLLAEARDLLLPRLIAGELDVSELDLDLEPVA